MSSLTFTPTCRYEHGPLVEAKTMAGKKVNFGIVLIREGELEQPGFMNGLRYFFCTQCGYSEIFDDEPLQTLKNMEGA